MASQVLDVRTQKGMTVSQSNEHLRVRTQNSLKLIQGKGHYDPSREHLNFEVGKGGVILPLDKNHSIPQRMKENLTCRGIADPNEGKARPDRRTVVSIIMGGSRKHMRRIAFGDQQLDDTQGADNSHITRQPLIEDWAKDMYEFISKKFGEENIVAFVVHLDELNPHIHCTLLPIDENNKFNYKRVFCGDSKFSLSDFYFQLHDELAVVNERYDLKRGTHIADSGARHRTTEQYLRDLDRERTKLEERCGQLQAENIAYQKVQWALQKEIAKAETRVKGLTTMIHNLEEAKERIANQMDNLRQSADLASKEKQTQLYLLEKQLEAVQMKLEDKQSKLVSADERLQELGEQLNELGKRHTDLAEEYEQLKQDVGDILPEAQRKAYTNVGSALSEMMIEDTKVQFSHLSKTDAKTLDNFEDTLLMDVAERGQSMVAVASALFLGYVDQATEFAKTHGGGGGPGTGWGRRDGEDDRQWARRCVQEAARMMGGRRRGRKR